MYGCGFYGKENIIALSREQDVEIMFKYHIRKLEDLKDSRLLFDKKPPAFGYIILLLVVGMCIFSLVWSTNTFKKYIVKAQGVITSENAIYVMSAYSGKITKCNIAEGKVVQKGDVLLEIGNPEFDLQREQLEANKASYADKVEKYRRLVDSVKDDTNYFSASDAEESLYYSMFENYKSQVSQAGIDISTYKAYGYIDEQIEKEITKNQGKISEIYYSTIQSAESAIAEAEQQIMAIDAQLSAIESGEDAYVVTASESGVIHMINDYKEGMVVQASAAIAQITPEQGEIILEAYVTTADMARINEDDEVQINIDGLSQNVYGSLTGRVKQIDSNLTARENADGSSAQVFKIKVSVDSDYLISSRGDKVIVVNGMTGIATIIYDKETYFEFLLDKLGITS